MIRSTNSFTRLFTQISVFSLFVWVVSSSLYGQTIDILSVQKISQTEGGLGNVLDVLDEFGGDVINVGDLDGDGVADLAVNSTGDDDGGTGRGAVYILFMNGADSIDGPGTVKGIQKISDTEGGFEANLSNDDRFGLALANIGDLDGDGVVDLAASAPGDDDGGANRGAVYVLFLNDASSVDGPG